MHHNAVARQSRRVSVGAGFGAVLDARADCRGLLPGCIAERGQHGQGVVMGGGLTPEGDRFAATGWRVRSGTGVVTAAAVEEAQRRAREAAAVAELARAHLTEARITLARARDARAAAERAADRHASACEAGRLDRQRAAEEQHRLAGELDDARAAVAAAHQRLADVTAEQA